MHLERPKTLRLVEVLVMEMMVAMALILVAIMAEVVVAGVAGVVGLVAVAAGKEGRRCGEGRRLRSGGGTVRRAIASCAGAKRALIGAERVPSGRASGCSVAGRSGRRLVGS